MTVGGMDLNLLIALRAMLEESNVTRAGERIGMAQPAMSAALARLRRHYRDDLLVRVGRDYELTPFARSLLPLIQQTMPMVEVALALRDEFDPATSARAFSITLSDYAFTVLNAPLVQRIAQAAPGVRLDLAPIPWDMHISDRGLLQCDFLVGPLGCGLPGKSAVLFRDRFVCVADPANERLAGGTLEPAGLRGGAARGGDIRPEPDPAGPRAVRRGHQPQRERYDRGLAFAAVRGGGLGPGGLAAGAAGPSGQRPGQRHDGRAPIRHG